MIRCGNIRKSERSNRIRRAGFTLMELLLALGLAAVVAGMMGSLIQIYLINQEKGQDSVRQAQLARAILNMISEDVRTVVRPQTFDASGLEELLSTDTGSGGGSGGAPSGASPAGGASGAPSTQTTAGAATGGGSSGAASGGETADPNAVAGPLPPGIYGTSTSIEIDVSRLPRPDEYFPQLSDPTTGALGDMPSDIKTVGYYIQSPQSDGVLDPLATLTQNQAVLESEVIAPANGGLVRRSVDRAVTQYAYDMGNSSQLLKTGQLIAPEVLAIEFQYFDGTTWMTEWDGSKQGLPQVVKITIAMQRGSFVRSNPLDPGIAISALTSGMMQEYGVEVFSTNTIIPGAQLLVAPAGTTATGSGDTGMGALGL
jgi:prepilin-type N-terminal cleavage/methylation domain-containing protein